MIEVFQEKHGIVNTALQLNRYKRQGYTILGVGYPFFRNELQSLIALCDWFVDDINNPIVPKWKSQFKIIDIKDLHNFEKIVVVALSNNRHKIFKHILDNFKQIPSYIIFDQDIESYNTLTDVNKSSLLTYRYHSQTNLCILDSINVNGKCLISQESNGEIIIGSLSLFDGATIKIKSRNRNIIDSLILQNNASIITKPDSIIHVRNCYIGKNTKLIAYSGSVNIEDVYLGNNCNIHVYDKLNIGSGSIISWNVSILDGDGHSLNDSNIPKGINICNNVWIANNAIILKGVSIGEGSVIGAGSVVTHSIPPFSLAVGNPAKVIKSNIKWKYGYKF